MSFESDPQGARGEVDGAMKPHGAKCNQLCTFAEPRSAGANSHSNLEEQFLWSVSKEVKATRGESRGNDGSEKMLGSNVLGAREKWAESPLVVEDFLCKFQFQAFCAFLHTKNASDVPNGCFAGSLVLTSCGIRFMFDGLVPDNNTMKTNAVTFLPSCHGWLVNTSTPHQPLLSVEHVSGESWRLYYPLSKEVLCNPQIHCLLVCIVSGQ